MVEYLRVFVRIGFFRGLDFTDEGGRPEGTPVDKPQSGMAQQIAQAAKAFEQERTGHRPESVTVVLCDDALVITLHGALSEAEKALAKDPEGAAKVQEFHRQLFASAAETLRKDIERITGVKVREATAEIEPSTGTVVQVFTTGTVVQVFLLAGGVETDVWSDDRPSAKQ
ncbi:MAG TPA: DUF2294 domain-containing protein [Phycisphaerae bacterium]|nr:DUF2294 domain-containing protein [Phycisphaerae bacterium]